MRKITALLATIALFITLGMLSAPGALAQTDGDGEAAAEECFETLVTIETRPIFTTERIGIESGVPPYNITTFQDNVVPNGTVDVEVTEEVGAPCPDTPDEVLGISQVPSPPLAVTGSSVSFPVAIGFGLIGAGGLALTAARNRKAAAENN